MKSHVDTSKIIPKDLFENVLTQAQKYFVSGYVTRAIYKDQVDARFKHNILQIPGSNLFVCKGPIKKDLSDFFNDLLASGVNFKSIVAIGSRFGKDETYMGEDFWDYAFTFQDSQHENYFFTNKTTDHYPENDFEMLTNRTLYLRSQQLPENKKFLMTFLHFDNYHPFRFNKDTPEVVWRTLWQRFEEAQRSPVLIHDDFGLGLAGQLVLTFRILENEVFTKSHNINEMLIALEEILYQMRVMRPGLVLSPDEYKDGIITAYQMLEFKKLQCQAENTVSVSKVKSGLFSQRTEIPADQTVEKSAFDCKVM